MNPFYIMPFMSFLGFFFFLKMFMEERKSLSLIEKVFSIFIMTLILVMALSLTVIFYYIFEIKGKGI